jgi:hypothetical protein
LDAGTPAASKGHRIADRSARLWYEFFDQGKPDQLKAQRGFKPTLTEALRPLS